MTIGISWCWPMVKLSWLFNGDLSVNDFSIIEVNFIGKTLSFGNYNAWMAHWLMINWWLVDWLMNCMLWMKWFWVYWCFSFPFQGFFVLFPPWKAALQLIILANKSKQEGSPPVGGNGFYIFIWLVVRVAWDFWTNCRHDKATPIVNADHFQHSISTYLNTNQVVKQ